MPRTGLRDTIAAMGLPRSHGVRRFPPRRAAQDASDATFGARPSQHTANFIAAQHQHAQGG
jgi:hypothetical protein